LQTPDPAKRRIPQGATAVDYAFPSGSVRVEILPEAAKLDVNNVPAMDLYRLALALGLDPERAQQISAAIDDWRHAAPDGSLFDPFYLSQVPSFRPPHASIQEIEELLLVRGVTTDLFYGTYVPVADQAGGRRLVRRDGLVDCLSVYGARDRVDANTAAPAVLAAVGLSPGAINALLERRRFAPLTQQQLGEFVQAIGPGGDRLRVEGNSIVTLRATARLRLQDGKLSDLKRTVAAQVKYMPSGSDLPYHTLRWYDTAWSY